VIGIAVIVLALSALGLGVALLTMPDVAPPPQEEEEAGLQGAWIPEERLVDIEIQGDVMTPDEITLEQYDYAFFTVTTDHPIWFYIRDYAIGEEASPEEPADIDFDAIYTGSFVIEDAETETELGTLIVEPDQEE
jgi:hypothetical protein